MQLKLTAELKPISKLKSLPTFSYEYEFEGVEGNLKNSPMTLSQLKCWINLT